MLSWRRVLPMATLFLALGGCLLGSLDHHAAEYDPYHEHVLLTARGATWVAVPPPHTHDSGVIHVHLAAPLPADRPDAGKPAGIRAVTSGGLTLLAIASASLASPQLSVELPPAPVVRLGLLPLSPVAGTILPPATPPPRAA